MYKLKLLFLFSLFFIPLFKSFGLDLTLNDTIDKIVTESQDLKSAEANLKKSSAMLDSVNANRWFSIDGSVNYMNLIDVERPLEGKGMVIPDMVLGMLRPPFNQILKGKELPDNILSASVKLKQPIYTFGRIGNAVDSLRQAVEMSKLGYDITMREVKYAANNIYWTAKMVDEQVKISEKLLSDTVSAKRQLLSAGRVSRANLVKIESDIAGKEIELSDAIFNRDIAYRTLKIFAGLDKDEEINLVDNFPNSFEEIEEKELESNPELEIMDKKIQMYESNASSKRSNHYPLLAAIGSYSYTATHSDINVFEGNKSQSAYVGLSLQVPIFDGGLSRANATIESMNAEVARQNFDKSKKMKIEEYRTAIRKYNHLRKNLSNLENARNLARKAYNISRDRFISGQTSAIELAEVQAGLAKLDLALLVSKYNILMSKESINKIGGYNEQNEQIKE